MNDVTYLLDSASLRASDVPNADWSDGANRAASCAPGIGIGTDETNLAESLPNWTLLDQAGAARNPQNSQHIGVGPAAINVADYANTDFNDTVSLTDLAAGWTRNAVA
jgi:hypothetical protein